MRVLKGQVQCRRQQRRQQPSSEPSSAPSALAAATSEDQSSTSGSNSISSSRCKVSSSRIPLSQAAHPKSDGRKHPNVGVKCHQWDTHHLARYQHWGACTCQQQACTYYHYHAPAITTMHLLPTIDYLHDLAQWQRSTCPAS